MTLRRQFLVFLISLLAATAVRAEYLPQAEQVADNVYAIVGPLGQRSMENDGLNANYGFVVTPAGVALIDSGASRLGAQKLAAAIRAVTAEPVRWVINTGSQDHRWLGNAYFAGQGAEILALERTAATQRQSARQQLDGLRRFLGERLAGTEPLTAALPRKVGAGGTVTLTLGGETFVLSHTDAHYPGDALVHLPKRGVVFAGDLVYVDRLLGVLPWSSVKNGQQAFRALAALKPARIVPGHGRVCELAQAQRETGDYYDFLADTVGRAARDMEPMDAVLDKHADLSAFRHLENYQDLHRANMNRAFTEFEGQ
jgi:glyoxylase-like metal-dependent hydrolase (beta-lactamase superfamily II)